jgi:D-glycero-D-manno-heptose 1,7-bisphosphate phosphatase
MNKPLLLLDRDGVLNRMVIDAEHGTIDSPLHPSEVQLLDGVPEALAKMTAAGYGLVLVSNQPAAAKRKTTRTNLEATHAKILREATRLGGQILSSHVCWHRLEDDCSCRKPRPGLLRQALDANPNYASERAWMVGDGVTDMQAGAALGLNTAFLGPRKCDACKIFSDHHLIPDWWGPDLAAFANYLINLKGGETYGGDSSAAVACENFR